MKNRLLHGAYMADFFVSDGEPFPVYHYIITTQESPQILFWGQCLTHEQAERHALETIRSIEALETKQERPMSFAASLKATG